MLGKLIKYEFRASGRLIPLVYLVVGLLLIAGSVLSLSKMYVYMGISFVMLFLAGAAAMIITYVVVFLRFYRGMYGSEGYLAMTLPVSPTQLYISKTIVAFCWLILSLLVTVASWVGAFAVIFRDEVFDSMRDTPSYLWEEFTEAMRLFFPPGIMMFFLIMSLVGYLAFVSLVYFCVTISNIKPFQSLGVGSAIIAYVVVHIVVQIASSLLSMYVPLSVSFNPDTGWYLSNTSMWSSMFQYSYYSSDLSIGLGSYGLTLLIAFVLPIFTIRLMQQKVNLK